ncbi:biotin/lipoyl-containing protein [Arthrobacter sedimenti]|uniref:biotin/lipoyl-containing protein n=1 Tax=Arthrobacter sedimenti TaxID=2694931 RepID=UPI001422B487|nr:biotin/lipoyl-containing protein [Arthrobacter sedimenti]
MEAIIMPALGQTSEEAHILEWLVKEGDEVEMGQPLLNVETDKAELEVECVADGVLLKIVCEAETTVNAGTVIAYIGEPGESVPTE